MKKKKKFIDLKRKNRIRLAFEYGQIKKRRTVIKTHTTRSGKALLIACHCA